MLGVCDKAGVVVSRARGHFSRRIRARAPKKPEGRRPRRGHHPRTQTLRPQQSGGALRFVAQADLKILDLGGRRPTSRATTPTWCTTTSAA